MTIASLQKGQTWAKGFSKRGKKIASTSVKALHGKKKERKPMVIK